MSARPLAGKGVVVTRPVHQAPPLARLIEAAGGRAIAFPSIAIEELPDPIPFLRLVDRLDDFEVAIFISPNAAERALRKIRARRAFPASIRVIAVGNGTAKVLEREGLTDVVAPPGRGDSDAVLALEAVAGARRVVVFRGAGGREQLAEALRAGGATVEYAECYRRVRPESDPEGLLRGWREGAIHAVTVTSGEGLRNLYEMVGAEGQEALRRTPLFVPHPRIADAARALGVERVVLTGPGDDGLATGLRDYFTRIR